MSFKYILYEKKGPVAWVSFNRPEKMNAFNIELSMEFREVMESIRRDDDILIVVIKGVGKHFSAGDDITEFNFIPGRDNDERARFLLKQVSIYQDTANQIEEMDKIKISMVRGACIGGGLEVTMVSDLVVASENSVFGIPEIDIDITPGWGGTQRLSRYVGRRRVKEMVLLGTLISAQEALRCGLVNRVVPDDKLEETVEGMIDILLSKRPLALKLMKFITTKGIEADLHTAEAFEALSTTLCFGTVDRLEGCAAFAEKRDPWKTRREKVQEWEQKMGPTA
ncbi:MAG: enoyl-CoA hydratase/isomerase family protein [Candidatus Freyarchaeota archaeon]